MFAHKCFSAQNALQTAKDARPFKKVRATCDLKKAVIRFRLETLVCQNCAYSLYINMTLICVQELSSNLEMYYHYEQFSQWVMEEIFNVVIQVIIHPNLISKCPQKTHMWSQNKDKKTLKKLFQIEEGPNLTDSPMSFRPDYQACPLDNQRSPLSQSGKYQMWSQVLAWDAAALPESGGDHIAPWNTNARDKPHVSIFCSMQQNEVLLLNWFYHFDQVNTPNVLNAKGNTEVALEGFKELLKQKNLAYTNLLQHLGQANAVGAALENVCFSSNSTFLKSYSWALAHCYSSQLYIGNGMLFRMYPKVL